MEILLIIGGIWILATIFGKKNGQKPSSRDNPPPYTPSPVSKPKQNPQTFRPSPSNRSTSTISFKMESTPSSIGKVPTEADLEGLHDAFTGAPLNRNLGLHQCQSCKVYYHTDSLLVLREANNSQCVACPSKNILAVISVNTSTGGRDYTPSVVTLQDYKQHEGSVVTFEGRVHKVRESQRGNDFAVMFEDKSWVSGFKLVFFSGAVLKVGGPSFINSLAGRKVKVRGLVIKHPKFGYEIIVSEKSMIMSVE